MAALVSWQTVTPATSVTAGAGANRVLAITAGGRAFAAGRTITALSYGTASIANGKVKQAHKYEWAASGSTWYVAYVFYVLEADIPAGANTLSDATWSGAMDGVSAVLGFATLQDRLQGTPEATGQIGANSVDPLSSTLTVGDNSAQILSGYTSHGASSATIFGSGWTEQLDSDTNPGAKGRTHGASKEVTAGGSVDFGIDFPAVTRTGSVAVASFGPAAAATPPTLTSITTPLVDGGAFTVSGSWTATGNVLMIGGVSQAITVQGATTLTGTVALGTRKYGPVDVYVIDGNGLQTGVLTSTLIPSAAYEYVDVVTPYPTSNRPETTATDVASGDQYRITNPINTTLANVDIDSGGGIALKPTNGALAASIDVQVNDGTGWGTAGTITFNVPSVGSTSPSYPRTQRQGRYKRLLNLGR